MADLSTFANSFVGAIVPFLTQLIRTRVIQVSGKAAMWLSLAVSTFCVVLAMLATSTPFVWSDLVANVGLAFTLSQTVYRHVVHVEEEEGGDSEP